MARQFGMALAPWDVLGGGKFQSKKAVEARAKQGEGLRSFFGAEQTEDEKNMSEALEKVAAEHNIESVTTIALVRSRPSPQTYQ
jgi:aryl-alcohol dehydrogenase-like predicted oxidoreductase